MITTNNITDEQIRELKRTGERLLSEAVKTEPFSGLARDRAMEILLVTANALHRNTDTSDANGTWQHWRARCAEILNARVAQHGATL